MIGGALLINNGALVDTTECCCAPCSGACDYFWDGYQWMGLSPWCSPSCACNSGALPATPGEFGYINIPCEYVGDGAGGPYFIRESLDQVRARTLQQIESWNLPPNPLP